MRRTLGILRAHGPAFFFDRAWRKVRVRWIEIRLNYRRRSSWRRLLHARRVITPVVFLPCDDPLVSIIIPVFNQLGLTDRCLHALRLHVDGSIPVEIILVDDASTDGTASYLTKCSGIRILCNETNCGFIDSVNLGASSARGTFLHFLNNDTIVNDGWLTYLLDALQQDARIAAAGSRLLAPDGRISEAGAIIWNDGSGSNYGRGFDPKDARYSYVRDVDYCSAASLLVRRTAFEQVGGFSGEYRPAYYEDVDLCFALRAAGYRVVYQPKSIVVHLEGGSSGTDIRAGAKQSQAVNQQIFVHKWADALANHYTPDIVNLEVAARRLQGHTRVLVVDTHVPFFDRDVGSKRLYAIIKLLQLKKSLHNCHETGLEIPL